MKQYTKNSAELLLEYLHEGLDVNYIDHENVGRTLLHKACLHRCWDMPGSDLVRTLIDFDADVNAKDDNGDTPLHLACTNIDKDTVDEDIIQLLVENGADPNAKNNEGDVAWIGLAYSYRHLASLWHLLAHGADVNSRGWYGLTALHGLHQTRRWLNCSLRMVRISISSTREDGRLCIKHVRMDVLTSFSCWWSMARASMSKTTAESKCKSECGNQRGGSAPFRLHVKKTVRKSCGGWYVNTHR